MLEVRDVRKTFDGFQAVGGVSLSIARGQTAAVIGPNGAGKTTLFNLITGHVRSDAGAVVLEGRNVTGLAPHDICRLGMGRSFQRTNIFPRLTVFENVQAAYLSHRGRGRDLWSRVERLYRDETDALLAALGLAAHAGETSGVLCTAPRSSSSSASRLPASRACCCSTSPRPGCRPERRARRSG